MHGADFANSVQLVLEYFSKYGLLFVFFIMFLEYLNFPGLGAAVIMPALGIIVSKSNLNFFIALAISVLAGVLASFILYGISYKFGEPIVEWLYAKYPKTRKSIDKTSKYIEDYGDKGVLISRLIPVARTLIPFVAGTFRMNIVSFTIYSTIGITIWNVIFIYIGYAFGPYILNY